MTALGNATARLREKAWRVAVVDSTISMPHSLAQRRRRLKPSMRMRSRSIKAEWCRASRQSRISSGPSSSIPTSPWRRRCYRAYTPTPASLHEAPAFSRRAFELRDRVSERERFFISWRLLPRRRPGLGPRALELSLSWTMTYPREAFAFNSLRARLRRVPGSISRPSMPFAEAISSGSPLRATLWKSRRIDDRTEPIRGSERDALAEASSYGPRLHQPQADGSF